MNQSEFPIEIDVVAVNELKESAVEDWLLLDCRENEEFEICQLADAKLLPMNETPSRINELASYQDKRIVVYCHGGVRSFQVASWLRQNGFLKAQSMSGGIDAWSLQVDPSVPRY